MSFLSRQPCLTDKDTEAVRKAAHGLVTDAGVQGRTKKLSSGPQEGCMDPHPFVLSHSLGI